MAIVYRNDIAGKICANPECGWKSVDEFHPRRVLGMAIGDGYKSRCKNCFNAQKRAERTSNAEKYKETARNYVESRKEHIQKLKRNHQKENPDRYDQALRKYRDAHRDELNAKSREKRQQDIEHYREIGRKSYERHADERREYTREYFKLYPEKSVAATNRRRARKRQAGGSHTIAEWESLKQRYAYTCLCCKKSEPEITLTRDHVVPLDKGGSDDISNIQPLCVRCNNKKRTRTTDYR